MTPDSLSTVIKQIANAMPDKIALEYGKYTCTYRSLDDKASAIGKTLNEKLAENRNVYILLDRSPALVEAILGILNAGGIFIPLDPDLPAARIGMMIEHGGGEWIVTSHAWLDKLNRIMKVLGKSIQVLLLDQDTAAGWDYEYLKPAFINGNADSINSVLPNKHCYIYFSSGSTGTPKAILGRQKSLMHFIDWETKECGVNKDFKISQLTAPSFDPFLRDVFLALCNGATLCIPPDNQTIMNPDALLKWFDEQQITLIHIVPSLFKVLVKRIKQADCLSSLKYILLAGEMLRGCDIKRFLEIFNDRIQLINLYGPTETTLAKLFYRISKQDTGRIRIPVGKPIAQAEAVILDEDLKPSRIGDTGEVYIRTPFISSGYYKNPELTRQVFIRNPFSDNHNDIIYKTGDLGIMHEDGNIELIGRIDHQVKIRGVRIEISEIESKLLSHAAISEAVVLDKEDTEGNKYLCAFFVSNEKITANVLREFLAEDLAGAMVPSQFIQVEQVPLTANGKTDRLKLATIKGEFCSVSEDSVPRTETEKKVAAVWKHILNVEQIGIYDKFLESGGNSLLLIQLYVQLEEEFPSLLNATDVFNNQTIQKLARLIDTRSAASEINIAIQPLQVPGEFFNGSGSMENSGCIRYSIDGTLLSKLKHIHTEEQVPLSDILFAMYIYLFAEITDNKSISMQTMLKIQNMVYPVEISLEGLTDFSHLFKTISKHQSAEQIIGYGLKDSKYLKLNYKENALVPLFYKKELYSEKIPLLEVYDIIMEISEEDLRVDFFCDYNAKKLAGRKIEELTGNYFKLIEMLADKY